MSKIETFNNEKELLGRIEQYKIDGVKEDTMTVISKDKLESPSFEYTNINFVSSGGTAWDKIVSFVSSDEPDDRVLSNFNLKESERSEYKARLDSGEIIFVVEGMGNNGTDAQDESDNEERTSSIRQSVEDVGRDERDTSAANDTDDESNIVQNADAVAHEEKSSVLHETDINVDDRDASLTTLPETEENESLREMPYDDGIDRVDMSKYQLEDEEEDQEIVNKEMLDAPMDRTLVDTHNNPDVAREIEDEENEIVIKHSDGTAYTPNR